MRTFASVFMTLCFAFSVPLLSACASETGGPEPQAVLPDDAASLKALNDNHVRQVRRIERQCSANLPAMVTGGGCLVAELESYMASQASPELEAFNNLLTRDMRYDAKRSWAVVQQRLEAQGILTEQ